jgi:hypothetical protein
MTSLIGTLPEMKESGFERGHRLRRVRDAQGVEHTTRIEVFLAKHCLRQITA